MADRTLPEVAEQAGVLPSSLRPRVREGVVALRGGRRTAAAVAPARLVARLRARGLEDVRTAGARGWLALGLTGDRFPAPKGRCGDGDDFWTTVDLGSRVRASATGREVLVRREVRNAGTSGVAATRVADVLTEGSSAPTGLDVASAR